jgi:sulfopyruvate decarboxylase TPP-binding subunit
VGEAAGLRRRRCQRQTLAGRHLPAGCILTARAAAPVASGALNAAPPLPYDILTPEDHMSTTRQNGAQALMKTLADAGIEVCFTNPGTSEMHFVAALDSEPRMRAVLALFEGVATGAADGYARMADKPAATLLHLGCGLGNGLANLHNARKGKVPVVNIVGDHATTHTPYDAQLQSDIETVARNVSPGFVRTSQTTASCARTRSTPSPLPAACPARWPR